MTTPSQLSGYTYDTALAALQAVNLALINYVNGTRKSSVQYGDNIAATASVKYAHLSYAELITERSRLQGLVDALSTTTTRRFKGPTNFSLVVRDSFTHHLPWR